MSSRVCLCVSEGAAAWCVMARVWSISMLEGRGGRLEMVRGGGKLLGGMCVCAPCEVETW